jgi:NAD(P)-dependent dehydrogenase (short-subunit alcohol dehydrogenase family)
MKISQPVVIVAGAGAAGAALTQHLAMRDVHVVLLDTNADAAAAVAEPLAQNGLPVTWKMIDLLDVEQVIALRDRLNAEFGRIDGVVHLVGGWHGSPTLDVASVGNWIALNPPIVGTLATITAVLGERIKASERGRVVMVTSTAAKKPTAGNIAYASAKAAAEAWMQGVSHYFRDTDAAAVTVAIKALLTDQMIVASPEKEFPGFTHVNHLAEVIADLVLGDAVNGSRIDLTLSN